MYEKNVWFIPRGYTVKCLFFPMLNFPINVISWSKCLGFSSWNKLICYCQAGLYPKLVKPAMGISAPCSVPHSLSSNGSIGGNKINHVNQQPSAQIRFLFPWWCCWPCLYMFIHSLPWLGSHRLILQSFCLNNIKGSPMHVLPQPSYSWFRLHCLGVVLCWMERSATDVFSGNLKLSSCYNPIVARVMFLLLSIELH